MNKPYDQMTVGEKVRLGDPKPRATCSYCFQKGEDRRGNLPVLRRDGWGHDLCRNETYHLLSDILDRIAEGEEPEEVSG